MPGAISIAEATTKLNMEEYLQEGEISARYEIIDGVRIFMPSPTRRHQRIVANVNDILRQFERAYSLGKAYIAPCDVLIGRVPMNVRQPDALFISSARLESNEAEASAGALSPAPEIIVEVLSSSDRPTVLYGKLADYALVNVEEAWIISPEDETVELLRRNDREVFVPHGVFSREETLNSLVFPVLNFPVADLFRD